MTMIMTRTLDWRRDQKGSIYGAGVVVDAERKSSGQDTRVCLDAGVNMAGKTCARIIARRKNLRLRIEVRHFDVTSRWPSKRRCGVETLTVSGKHQHTLTQLEARKTTHSYISNLHAVSVACLQRTGLQPQWNLGKDHPEPKRPHTIISNLHAVSLRAYGLTKSRS